MKRFLVKTAAVFIALNAAPAHSACGVGYTEALDRKGEPQCVSESAARTQEMSSGAKTREETLRLQQQAERLRLMQPQQTLEMRQRAYRDDLIRRQRERSLLQRGQ